MKDFPPITIILRGYSETASIRIADILDQYECFSIEVALNSEDALNILSVLMDRNYKNLPIGAGTVLDIEKLRKVIEIGCSFVLSPVNMSNEMLKICDEKDIISIPGAYSPTEVHSMYSKGANIVKLFPANMLNLDYCKSIMAPLGELPIMAVGGVNVDNFTDYLSNGFKYVGIGSGLGDKDDIENGDLSTFKENIKLMVHKVRELYEK